MSSNREKRNKLHAAIERERNPSIFDLEWMARRGELLKPRPIPVEHRDYSSNLYGPQLRTVQLERVEVITLPSREEL